MAIKASSNQIDYLKVQDILEIALGSRPYEDREQLEEAAGLHLEDLEPGDKEKIVEYFAYDGVPF